MIKMRIKLGWLSILTALMWLIIIAAVAVIWNQTGASETRYLKELDRSLETIVRAKLPDMAAALNRRDFDAVRALCSSRNEEGEVRLTVIAPNGDVIADSRARYDRMDNHLDRPEVGEALGGKPVATQIRFSGTANSPSLYCAMPITVDNQRYVFRGALGMGELESVMRRARQNLLLVGIAVAAILSLLSFYVVHKVIFPLRRLRKTASRIAAGDFEVTLPATGPGEVGRLALPLGQLAEQLRSRYDEVNRRKQERDMVFNAMNEGLVLLSPTGALVDCNRAATAMFGFTGQTRNQPLRALVRSAALHEFIEKVGESHQELETELALDQGEEPCFVRVRGVEVSDAPDERKGILLVFTDITRIRRLENFRRDFIANVSHEIKTPLTVIQGAAETLLEGALDDPASARRFLDIIETHCRRLNLLVQDILSISNLEERTMQERDRTEFLPVDLADVGRTAVELCRPRLQSTQRLDFEPGLGSCVVAGDAATLEQAVINLVDNAIKYAGENAAIVVRLSRHGHEAVIEVSDNGVGISGEHLGRIFERFYRVDKARSRKAGGTGLGLSIVKHIAQWHRGQAEVTSAVGQGTTFRIRLPLAAS